MVLCINLSKNARIVCIFKRGSKELIENYRPIAMLSPLLKNIEKIVAKRIFAFISKHYILNENQFGFKSKYSTISVLIKVIEEIYN